MVYRWINPIWAECIKELSLYRRYPLHFMTIIIIMYLVFLQLYYVSATFGAKSSLLGELSGSSNYLEFVFLGFIFWNIGLRSMTDVTQSIHRDIVAGLIENLLVSPSNSSYLFLGRGLASFITSIIYVTILAIPILFLFSMHFHWDLFSLLAILFLTVLGIQGFSIGLAGIQFLMKNIGSTIQLLNFLFLYLCGIIFPISLLPEPIQVISKILPITLGLESIREIMLAHVSMSTFFTSPLFLYLFIQSILYYVGGMIVYKIMYRIAKNKGTLGQY